MRSSLFLFAAVLAASGVPAQSPPAAKVLFKDEIDGLVRNLRTTAPPGGGLGDGSVLQTAQVLTAMGWCHRFYAVTDGPVVRTPLTHLARHRGADRLYHEPGDAHDAALVTRWVIDALAVLGPREYRQDIEDARSALREAGKSVDSPFAQRVQELQAGAADAGKVAEAMAQAGAPTAARVARGLIATDGGAPDHAANVAALLHLVACQVAARGRPLPSAAPAAAAAAATPWSDAQQRGVDYLLGNQQDGVFQVPTPDGKKIADVGFTALCLAAVQTKPKAARSAGEQQVIDAGLAWLAGQQRPDGTFSDTNDNYIACTAILALTAAQDPKWQPAIDKARKLVLALQNVESRGYGRGDRDYGSIGYGGDERGDLSNLQFAVEALRKSGLEPGQTDAFEKALVFLQRCQNLPQVNDLELETRDEETGEWRKMIPGNDGGSMYYPGNSPMGHIELPDGRRIARSYGSMTYALLKAYTLCGLPADDARILAAVRWLGEHFTLEENPGADPALPEKTRYQGLYYYYMVLAQALTTAGIDKLPVERGSETREIDWRAELRAKLESLQQKDGSWVNTRNGRWWEMLPMTCTCYALLALDRCK